MDLGDVARVSQRLGRLYIVSGSRDNWLVKG